MLKPALKAPMGMFTVAGTVALSVRLLARFTDRAVLVAVLRVTVALIAGFKPAATTSWASAKLSAGP